ncbi:MAG: exodeoxyribonuclease III [Gammaproteobacteria bacterium]|nr:exodeoxyribonuclease III [Gammaproteobacteria bacterium]
MKIITLNVNGIRSACGKGFLGWMLRQKADVVCMQETRIQHGQLPAAVASPPGYAGYFKSAETKGYSGVAVYSRHRPTRVVDSLGWDTADREGRYLQLDFDRLSVASIYLPSGTSGAERQAVKFDFLDRLGPVLRKMRRSRRQYILCGDWNIAHRPIDLKNWRANQKHSGFLPEERAWLDFVFDDVGLVDAFRVVNREPDQYTWWSNRGRAWEKNVGWRIDYQIITPGLRKKVRRTHIFKERRFSDHAPLIIEYELDLQT